MSSQGSQYDPASPHSGSGLKVIASRRSFLALPALLIFVIASLIACWQVKAPFSWHKPRARFSLAWLFHPVDWNVEAGLPQIKGDIRALAYSPQQTCLWIGGDAGLLAYSANDGRSWSLLNYSDGRFAVSVSGAWPCLRDATQPVALSDNSFSLIPRAYGKAMAGAAEKPPQSSSSMRPSAKPAANSAKPAGDPAKSDVPQSAPSQEAVPQSQNPLNTQSPPNTQNPSNAQNSPSAEDKGVSTKTGPAISLFPEAYDFGSVKAGESASTVVVVRTLGPDPVALSPPAIRQVTGEGLAFRIESSTCGRQLSDKSCEITVGFEPKAKDEFDATLTMSDDVDKQSYTVKLSGNGVLDNLPRVEPSATPKPADHKLDKPESARQKEAKLEGLSLNPPNLVKITFLANGIGYLVGSDAITFQSNDGGQSWLSRRAGGSEALAPVDTALAQRLGVPAVYVYANWAVGPGGLLFRRTEKGSDDWTPASLAAATSVLGRTPVISGSYGRFVAPWYWLALAIAILLVLPLLRPRESFENEPGTAAKSLHEKSKDMSKVTGQHEEGHLLSAIIGNQVISDKPLEPGEPDVLGLTKIAAGLSFFLRNDKTKPPLVIGINGRWGSGKSSLMNLLRSNLMDYGAHPVWFNAWHHQKEEQLLAALLQAVKQQAVPSLGELGGLLFRARLAVKRLRRYWFYFALIAAACILVYRTELYLRSLNFNLWSAIDLFARDSNAFKSLVGISGDSVPGPLTIIATTIAVLKLASRGLVAFGSNPASLLASMSGGTKAKDLDAQTEFRQRFASEFSDVTRSLGRNQRMLILIDDLDRCRPEKVREVLEAVNFLVSSGDCFVVLGMAREIVEHCVGLSFRRIVDSMKWEALGLSQDEIEHAIAEMEAMPPLLGEQRGPNAADGVPSLEICAKRREFARLYLDKLVQIQVSVPEPGPKEKRKLFETVNPWSTDEVARQKLRRARSLITQAHSIVGPLFQFALLTAAIAGFGVLVGNSLKPAAEAVHLRFSQLVNNSHEPEGPKGGVGVGVLEGGSLKPLAVKINDQIAELGTTAPEATTPRTEKVKSNASPPAATGNKGSGQVEPIPVAEPPRLPAPAVVNPGFSPMMGTLAGWPFALVLLGALTVTSSALRRMPIRDVTDTREFTDALTAWHPLILTAGARNTPRTAKRFQNRVRYLAMRQWAIRLGQPLSTGEWLLRRLYHVPMTDADSSELPAVVPEPLLVALAAIDEFAPELVSDPQLFASFVVPMPDQEVEGGTILGKDRLSSLRAAKRSAHWHETADLEAFRVAFLLLSREVERSSDAAIKRAT